MCAATKRFVEDMSSSLSTRFSQRRVTSHRTPPQLVDAESFLSEGRGRRLFPEKYRTQIQFGDGTTAATSVADTGRSTSAHATSSLPTHARRDSAPSNSVNDSVSAGRSALHPHASRATADGSGRRGGEEQLPSVRPQRRQRGPGTAYARYIEENGFPEGAARRHHGDDTAAKERLRPFYTVEGTGDDHPARSAKRIRHLEFGRDRRDVREPLNLFEQDAAARWLADPMADGRGEAQRSPRTLLSREDTAEAMADRIEKQSMRVAYLQRLLEAETAKLLAMAQCLETNSSTDEDAHGGAHVITVTPKHAVAGPRHVANRRRQPWEMEVEEADESSTLADDVTTAAEPADDGLERRALRHDDEGSESHSSEDDSSPHLDVRQRREYAIGLPRSSGPRDTASHTTASRIRILPQQATPASSASSLSEAETQTIQVDSDPAPSATTSEEAPLQTMPSPFPRPNWKSQLLAKAKARDQPSNLFTRPRQVVSEADDTHTVQRHPPHVWQVAFPARTERPPPPAPAPLARYAHQQASSSTSTALSPRATMRGRSRDSSRRDVTPPRAATAGSLLDTSSVLATSRWTPHSGQSLLDVLGSGARSARFRSARHVDANDDSVVTCANTSCQSLRDVFEAVAVKQRLPR